MEKSLQISIGVPGNWPTRKDIVAAIAEQSNGFLFAGSVIMNLATNEGFELHVYEHDPELRKAFAIAGRGKLTEADLEAINQHTHTLYALAAAGSVKAGRKIMAVACGLLRAGGLAVKVESAGVAHSANQWLQLAEEEHLSALYHAYVTLVGGEKLYF